MPSYDDENDNEKEDENNDRGEGEGEGKGVGEGGATNLSQDVEENLEYLRKRDILADRLRWRRCVIGGAFALLFVAALALAIALGLAASSESKSESASMANGGNDAEGGQQQQQQQQQQGTTDSLVGINDDVIAIPLPSSPSSYMEDVYVSVLDNDSYVVVGGGPSASLVVTNITRQPARGGECLISLDMTQVVYSPPPVELLGGGGLVDECGYEACMLVQGYNDGPYECGVAVVKIRIQDMEEEEEMVAVEGDGDDDDDDVEDEANMPSSTKAMRLPDVSDEGDVLNKDAVVAIHGDTAIVGAHHIDGYAGVVLVYERGDVAQSGEGGAWDQRARLTLPDDERDMSYFGWSLGVHDGTIIVGAWGTDENMGSAHVYVRDDDGDDFADDAATTWGEWTRQARLEAPDGAPGMHFGYDVAIHGDVAVISAFTDGASGPASSSSVYVFVRDGTAWTYRATLTAPDGEENDWFGNSVDVHENTIVVGAWWDDDNIDTTTGSGVGDDDDGGMNSGSAHVFVRDGIDYSWSHQAKLMDAVNGNAEDRFGNRVAIHGDTVIVGARGDDHDPDDVDGGGKVDTGSAYVFGRTGESWTMQAMLVSPHSAPGDQFGNNVAIYEDTVVVGARWDDDAEIDSGSAHVFVKDGDDGAWTHRARLVALGGGEAEEYFGFTIGIDNGTIVVGSVNGKAYLYSDYLGR